MRARDVAELSDVVMDISHTFNITAIRATSEKVNAERE